MRRFIWLALAILAVGGTARAQETPAAEVSLGYSYLRLGGSGGINQNGGSASAAFNVNHWFGVVGEVGGYHASPFGVGLDTYTFLVGPRFSYRNGSRVTPFAQVLVGGAHLTAGLAGETASTTAFAFSTGGGVDLRVSRNIAFRPQLDYIGMRSNGSTLNCTRASASVVFRFGGK
jgi:outer membrane immunogenic protein